METTLFDTRLVSLEDVNRLQGFQAQPKIWIWLITIFQNGDLERTARALVRAGTVSNGSEVPEFMAKLAREIESGSGPKKMDKVTFGDLQRLRHTRLTDFLKDYLGEKHVAAEDSEFKTYTSLGRLSHRFAEWLYSHNVKLGKTKMEQLSLLEEMGQLTLFELEKAAISPSSDLLIPEETAEPIIRENRRIFSDAFMRRATEYFADIASLVETPNAYAQSYFKELDEIARFRAFMRFAFPEHYALLPDNGPLVQALTLSALAGWLKLLKRRLFEERNVVALTEIPVLPRDAEVWAGRIDRLDIHDGNLNAFRGIRQNNLHSAADFVEKALRVDSHATVEVVDYKFSAGDYGGKLIPADAFEPKDLEAMDKPTRKKEEDLMRALAEHQSQVQWYLLWLGFRHDLALGGTGKKLHHGDLFTGRLVYVMPNGTLIDKPVAPSSRDLEERFIDQVVRPWHTIIGKRNTRVFNNGVTLALRDHLKSNHGNDVGADKAVSRSQTDVKESSAQPTQEILIPASFEHQPVRALVDSYKTFIGIGDTIEQVFVVDKEASKKQNKTVMKQGYRLHLGRLIKAAEAGVITLPQNFLERRDGMIRCLVHKENNPSMRVYLGMGLFKCFSCGIGGTFAREDIPTELLDAIPKEHIGARRVQSFGKIHEIPDITVRIMATAQEILSRNFPSSMAEKYLTQKRFLDRDLVRSAGAGCTFCTERNGSDILIEELVGAGFSIEELELQRFIRYSENWKGYNPAARALRRHGIPDDIICRRETRRSLGKKGSVEIISWPYVTLLNRVTFPLTLPIGSKAVVTSFYGRDISGSPKAKKHHFLTPENVPKGMFNAEELVAQLTGGGIEMVYLTEAVIDALVLKTLGHGPVASIVGTGTAHLEQMLAHLNPGEIKIALDFDKAGIDATKRLTESFRKKGYGGPITDFADEFSLTHLEVVQNDCDDFGTWWAKFGRHNHPLRNF